jgi:hypothetical protein
MIERCKSAPAGNADERSAKIGVVAEGVETEQQHAELQKIGCQIGHGFFDGKAVSCSEVEAIFGAGSTASAVDIAVAPVAEKAVTSSSASRSRELVSRIRGLATGMSNLADIATIQLYANELEQSS